MMMQWLFVKYLCTVQERQCMEVNYRHALKTRKGDEQKITIRITQNLAKLNIALLYLHGVCAIIQQCNFTIV